MLKNPLAIVNSYRLCRLLHRTPRPSQITETVYRETGRMTLTSRLHDYSTPIAGNILRITEWSRTDCACNASLGVPAWMRKIKSPPAKRTQHSGTERPESTTSNLCSYRTCGRFVSPLCDLRRTEEKAPRHSACFSVEHNIPNQRRGAVGIPVLQGGEDLKEKQDGFP